MQKFHKGKKDEKNDITKDITKIGKTMCYLLRHQAVQHGLAIETTGFVNLDDLLNCQPIKKLKVTKEIIFDIVKSDNKGRYELINRPPYFIRAVQGHSLKSVKDEDILDPIHNIFEYPVVVHGTYFEAWQMIKSSGLNRMSRNCIHFSIGYKKEDHVLSGMRNNCQVYIELNAIQAHHSGIKFFVSKNKVILSPGIDGVISSKFIKKAVDHENKYLFSQNYEIGILMKLNNITANEFKGDYSIIDIEKKSLIHNDSLSNLESIYQLPKYFTNKELFSKPYTIILPTCHEDTYRNLILSRQDEIENIAFYCEYILIDDSEVGKDIKDMDLSGMNAMKIKKIEIDYKRHYDKSNINSNANTTMSSQDQNENSISLVNISNQIDDTCSSIEKNSNYSNNSNSNPNNKILSDFRLTKKILLDKNMSKNYLLLFLNFDQEQDDILTSIDYILIPDGKLDNIKYFNYTLQSQQIKENLNNFLKELKHNLSQEKVLEKLLILCTNKNDLEYINSKMKKNSIKIPKMFLKNVILLNSEDFYTLEQGEYKEAAELFLLQYVMDESTIDKIKIHY